MFRLRGVFKSIVWFIIPLVLVLYFNQVSNWHSHVLHNGLVIEHSHPFKNSKIPGTPFQNHHHSDFDYLLLAQMTLVLTLLATAFVFGLIGLRSHFDFPIFSNSSFVKTPELSNNLLRAPPANG
jgi:hypothetical protein